MSQELAYRLLAPGYEGYQLRPDGMPQDVGVTNAIWERHFIENNIQFSGRNGEDSFGIVNDAYADLVIPKETCTVELQLCAPTWVFNRSTRIAPNPRNGQPLIIPKEGSHLNDVMRTYTWAVLPNVIIHRSMWALRCLWKRDLTWAGTLLFDSTETGVAEMCWNIAYGLMGESYDREWWQKRLPTPMYEEKDSVYAQTATYAISGDEFPGWNSGDFPNDYRVIGLKISLPYYVLQAPDLTYASRYAQNRTQTVMKGYLGFVVGPYAFLSKNTEEVPFCEHDFETGEGKQFHIPRSDQMSQTNLPGSMDKYLALYLDTASFKWYSPFHTRKNTIDILSGPTVIGFTQIDGGTHFLFRQKGDSPLATDNGKATNSNKNRYSNDFNQCFAAYNNVREDGSYDRECIGDIKGLHNYIYSPLKITPFRDVVDTLNGYVPCCPRIFRPTGDAHKGSIQDCWFQGKEAISFWHTPNKSLLIPGISSYGSGGVFFRRPYITAVVGNGCPAALPFRFSGADNNKNCATHRLSFKLEAVLEDGGGGARVDNMKKFMILSADEAEGGLHPNINFAPVAYISRGLVNLQMNALIHMLNERDSNMGMASQSWHSNDTQEGIFKLSPKEIHSQIILNGTNNTPTYSYYFIHATRYTKANCKREHPMSLTDFDCFPFNQLFKEITIKWKTNNSAGEQLCWKYHNDPEMEVFYSFFVSYMKAFWPEKEVPSREMWLMKPVIIFSPNTHFGCPDRKFTQFNTGSITLDLTYRDGLSVNDFYSLFGENYNFDFDPTILYPNSEHIIPAAGGANRIDGKLLTPMEFNIGPLCDGTVDAHPTAANEGSSAVLAEYWFNPNARRDIQGQVPIHFDFATLMQNLSPPVIKVVMTNSQTLWFAGTTSTGGVPCVVFVRAGGTGPTANIAKK